MSIISKVTDFLQVTLVDDIEVNDITDMDIITIIADEDKESIYKVALTNEVGSFEALLAEEDYFLLLDDLGK